MSLRTLPGTRETVEALGGTLGLMFIATGLVVSISAADRGVADAMRPREVLTLIGPLCAAIAVAVVVVRSRVSGRADAWAALGVTPRRQVVPLALVLGLGGGLVQLAAPPLGGSSATLRQVLGPAPIDAEARLWPEGEGWAEPDLALWQVPPSVLTLGGLWERARTEPPAGARRGLDRAELLRRTGFVAAWPVAVVMAIALGRRRKTRGGQLDLAAPALAALGVVGWTLGVLVVAAYSSSGM